MKNQLLLSLSLILSASMLHASEPELKDTKASNNLHFEHQKQVALALAKVKSKADLEELALQESPLDLLPAEAKQRFIDSIVFNERGIGGYYYSDLEAELTPTQIHSILSLIGVQHTVSKLNNARIETNADMLLMLTPNVSPVQQNLGGAISIGGTDHKGYYCASRGTCREEDGSICTSNC